MKIFFYTLALLALSVKSFKVLNTNYGKVRGITDFSDKRNHKYIFKGIPFAKPPLGLLRFALPEEPNTWNGVLDGSKYSAACLSNSSLASAQQENISEDCLYINIFTSEYCLAHKCPVLVYYHGGSFNLDSATMFPDKFILERYVDSGIVFAIPAYRLGVFGQFYLGEQGIVPANLLIHDCIRSLNFVHDNIASFGGDPNYVTLMGHSSGGQLVNAMGFSNQIDPEKKLFQQFIVLSSIGMYGFEDLQIGNSYEIARRHNCTSENSQEIVDCMRNIDALQLLQTQTVMDDVDLLFFKAIIRAPPLMDVKQKLSEFKENVTARNMLCGVTDNEFTIFKYPDGYYISATFLDFENPVDTVNVYRNKFTNITPTFVNSDSSAVFVSAATYSEALTNAGGNVYLFESRQKPFSMHVTDMQYFIGIHREKNHTTDMDILDSFYSKLLVNFTKFGSPSPNWEKYDPSKMNFMAMEIDTEQGIEPKMENGFHEELVNFWLINMMQIDRNIIEMKLNGEYNSFDGRAQLTTKHIGVPTSLPIIYAPAVSDPENLELISVLNQWWFYVSILLLFVIVSVLFIVCKKAVNVKRQPLLV